MSQEQDITRREASIMVEAMLTLGANMMPVRYNAALLRGLGMPKDRARVLGAYKCRLTPSAKRRLHIALLLNNRRTGIQEGSL